MVDFSFIQSMCMNKSHPNNLKKFTPDYFILIRYNYERCLEHTTCALGPPPPNIHLKIQSYFFIIYFFKL